MRFLLGVVLGATGMWAYRQGHLQRVMDGAPEPLRGTLQQVAGQAADAVSRPTTPTIIRPTEAEIAGRPAEPLPRREPEGTPAPGA